MWGIRSMGRWMVCPESLWFNNISGVGGGVVQLLSRVWLFATPWTAARQASLSSLSPEVCSHSCPLSRWCHPTISSSVTPFSSCLQSFPASGSFPVSQFFASGSQSFGASASASVLPMNIQGWFPLGLTSLISLLSKGLWRVFFSTTDQKHQFFTYLQIIWIIYHGYSLFLTRLLCPWGFSRQEY